MKNKFRMQLVGFVLMSLMIISCSENESDNIDTTSNKATCDVTLFGETIHQEYEEGNTFSYGGENCKEALEMRVQNVDQFEKANYFLDIYIVHNEAQKDFPGYNMNSNIIKNKTFVYDPGVCFDNLELVVSYEDSTNNDKTLPLNTDSKNINKILNVSIYKESQTEIIYSVKGEFEVAFKKDANTLIPVKGEYKTFIYVLK
jgi:hypothetical protein